jgi:hypothetical protein
VPLHAPLQPIHDTPASGAAVRVNTVPAGTDAEHPVACPAQLTDPDTAPDPVPFRSTQTVTFVVSGSAGASSLGPLDDTSRSTRVSSFGPPDEDTLIAFGSGIGAPWVNVADVVATPRQLSAIFTGR